ncbi:TerB family tellurite resistance protein [bacterium]|nr:TerB family tellurite resistance protein [candidate division CSSED10-310 bacterium]
MRTEDLQTAACVLMLETAHADRKFSDMEKQLIRDILGEQFDLTPDEITELMSVAERERSDSLDMWTFTNRINRVFTRREKIRIMENIWRVIYADRRMDQHEDYLAHKLANLLRLQHHEMIGAKVRIREELKLD